MKMADVVAIANALPVLLDKRLPIAVSLHLLRIQEDVRRELAIYEQMVMKLDGSDTTHQELLDTESELVIAKIPLADLGDIAITPTQLDQLRQVVELGEVVVSNEVVVPEVVVDVPEDEDVSEEADLIPVEETDPE